MLICFSVESPVREIRSNSLNKNGIDFTLFFYDRIRDVSVVQ